MVTTKVGVLAGVFAFRKDQDILVIANDGVVIRVPAVQVRKAGRATQGGRVMRLERGRSVVAGAPVVTQNEEEPPPSPPPGAGAWGHRHPPSRGGPRRKAAR